MSNQRATFPREARLLRPSQYRNVFARGNKFLCGGFVVFAADTEWAQARLGLALAKRRIRRAVDRNRVKRIVRESFRAARSDMPQVDIVVLARSKTAAMDNATLAAQLGRIWSRLARGTR